jgi:hypothetical protein
MLEILNQAISDGLVEQVTKEKFRLTPLGAKSALESMLDIVDEMVKFEPFSKLTRNQVMDSLSTVIFDMFGNQLTFLLFIKSVPDWRNEIVSSLTTLNSQPLEVALDIADFDVDPKKPPTYH